MLECYTPIGKPKHWLITTRNHDGSLRGAEIATTLLKAESTGAGQVFDLTNNLFSNKSRQQQNEALLYDGTSTLSINVGSHTVTIEPFSEK